jgi:putative colanic acid biosynthesis UDP-glucose lipid carrier transferase
MSIVGPRPHAVCHNETWSKLIEDYALRHHIKPGITGLAQVHGHRGPADTFEKLKVRVQFDLEYIDRWSFLFDLQILAKTAMVVLFQRTAY